MTTLDEATSIATEGRNLSNLLLRQCVYFGSGEDRTIITECRSGSIEPLYLVLRDTRGRLEAQLL